MIERFFEYIVVIIAIYLIYWMGRIDGFTKRRDIDSIDKRLSQTITNFQNFVFLKISRAYEIIKNFSENKLFLKFLATLILVEEILNKLEVSKLFDFN